MYQDNLTWNQLSPAQQTEIILYCDQYEKLQQWELVYSSYELVNGEVFFSDEVEH